MTQITLQNTTQYPALIYVQQGDTLTGRVPVDTSGGNVVIPTTNTYSVTATAKLPDGNTYTTGPRSFSVNSQTVLAQVLQSNGTWNFQLALSPGQAPSTITLENSCISPVTFTVTRNGSPLSTVLVVDAYNNATVSTIEEYSFYSVVNGVTSQTITTTNNNITVIAYQDTGQVSDWAGFSVRFG
jgi:hypothetical protein